MPVRLFLLDITSDNNFLIHGLFVLSLSSPRRRHVEPSLTSLRARVHRRPHALISIICFLQTPRTISFPNKLSASWRFILDAFVLLAVGSRVWCILVIHANTSSPDTYTSPLIH